MKGIAGQRRPPDYGESVRGIAPSAFGLVSIEYLLELPTLEPGPAIRQKDGIGFGPLPCFMTKNEDRYPPTAHLDCETY